MQSSPPMVDIQVVLKDIIACLTILQVHSLEVKNVMNCSHSRLMIVHVVNIVWIVITHDIRKPDVSYAWTVWNSRRVLNYLYVTIAVLLP